MCCRQREQCSHQEQDYSSCSIPEAPWMFLPAWAGVTQWGFRKRRAHWSLSVSFCDLDLVLLLSYHCIGYLFLKVADWQLPFCVSWWLLCERLSSLLCCTWVVAQFIKQGSHKKGINVWPKLGEASQQCPDREVDVGYHQQLAVWFSLKLVSHGSIIWCFSVYFLLYVLPETPVYLFILIWALPRWPKLPKT